MNLNFFVIFRNFGRICGFRHHQNISNLNHFDIIEKSIFLDFSVNVAIFSKF
jgi:hypothetical protein